MQDVAIEKFLYLCPVLTHTGGNEGTLYMWEIDILEKVIVKMCH